MSDLERQAMYGGEACPISIVVLSHNRRELLRRTLEALGRQTLPASQVVVVDNGSRDGSPQMVREGFPDAELLALPENVGVRGRNLGFQTARGDVVLSLDDDIELVRPDALARIHHRFSTDLQLGALTLKICDDPTGREIASNHWWHPVRLELFHDQEFETNHLNEAAVAFRRQVLEEAGGYYEALFWGGEEWDLTLGIMDAGYRVRYLPEPVIHLAPRGSLDLRADPRHALLVRNRCWIAFRRLPLATALGYVLPRLGVWALRSLRYGYLRQYLRGIAGLMRAAPRIARERRVISADTHRRLRALDRQTQGA